MWFVFATLHVMPILQPDACSNSNSERSVISFQFIKASQFHAAGHLRSFPSPKLGATFLKCAEWTVIH